MVGEKTDNRIWREREDMVSLTFDSKVQRTICVPSAEQSSFELYFFFC